MKSLLSDIVQDDGWQLYLVTDEARFFLKKIDSPKFSLKLRTMMAFYNV